MSALKDYLNKTVTVITQDGGNVVGILRGFDKNVNLVLEKAKERIYSLDKGVVQTDLGVYVIRGDNIAVAGEMDEDEDAKIDLSRVKAAPLKEVVH